MKKALCLLVLLITFSAAFAQLEYESYTVAATNGLTLRDAPDKNGAKVAIIPKGGRVSIAENVDSSLSFSVTEFPGFTIQGYWVKVRYMDYTGYVFSGYLSRFLPLLRYITPEGEQYNENEYEYFMRYFTERGHKPLNYFDQDSIYQDFETQFNEGIRYHYHSSEALYISIEFTQHSFQEVYLFYLLMTEPHARAEYNKETKEIYAFQGISDDPEEGVGCDYTITKKGKTIILSLFCHC